MQISITSDTIHNNSTIINMAQYLNFKQISATDTLKKQFIEQAQGMNLAKIISNCKQAIRTSFHQAIGYENVYLVMIIGSNDKLLIKLASKYGFPRGFPIIWIPNISMQYFGFYP